MVLEEYKQKRKFNVTTEPYPQKKIKKGENRFVVHEHHARKLHWDFRLEMPQKFNKGYIVLKSWAVPKGIPRRRGIKRLAVETEDHPVEYINFKGKIPKGEYGAGEVEIWDKGKYKNLELRIKNNKLYGLEFELEGEKLKGKYIMIKTNYGENNWLIFKSK